MVEAMKKAKINVQVYWKGSLVGPDCRRFLEKHNEILDAIVVAMKEEKYSEEQCNAFREYHARILQVLDKIGKLSRKVEMLSDSEIDELSLACKEYGAAARAPVATCLKIPKKFLREKLTPKGHTVECHLAEFAKRYGTIGFFGEDGIEALYPKDTAVRLLTSSVRNAKARAAARMLHMVRIQTADASAESKFKRQRRN